MPAYLIADRGYDSDRLMAARASRAYYADRYVQRHPVERLFSRLKQFRRVATRYDRLDAHFLALIHVAATVLWLRDLHFLVCNGWSQRLACALVGLSRGSYQRAERGRNDEPME